VRSKVIIFIGPYRSRIRNRVDISPLGANIGNVKAARPPPLARYPAKGIGASLTTISNPFPVP
jgi:hypothetical protein